MAMNRLWQHTGRFIVFMGLLILAKRYQEEGWGPWAALGKVKRSWRWSRGPGGGQESIIVKITGKGLFFEGFMKGYGGYSWVRQSGMKIDSGQGVGTGDVYKPAHARRCRYVSGWRGEIHVPGDTVAFREIHGC